MLPKEIWVVSKCFKSTFTECIWKEQGIHSIEKENILQELDNLKDEFLCQEACQNFSDCQLFYWKKDDLKCYLFSYLLNGENSIVNEKNSIIGQPNCLTMIPDWPKSLAPPSTLTRFAKYFINLETRNLLTINESKIKTFFLSISVPVQCCLLW